MKDVKQSNSTGRGDSHDTMLSTGEEWNPVDLCRVDMPERLKEQQLAKAVKQAIWFLETQGLTVS